MFDSYNYVRNNVIKNLKKYKYYACVQDFYKTKDMQTSDTKEEIVCYYTNNDNVAFNNDTIENLKNENGTGYRCVFSLNYKYNSTINRTVECNNFANWDGSVQASFRTNDFIYTNIDNTNYSSIIEDSSYTNNDNLSINQDFLYLVPFSTILVVLALWWFRK